MKRTLLPILLEKGKKIVSFQRSWAIQKPLLPCHHAPVKSLHTSGPQRPIRPRPPQMGHAHHHHRCPRSRCSSSPSAPFRLAPLSAAARRPPWPHLVLIPTGPPPSSGMTLVKLPSLCPHLCSPVPPDLIVFSPHPVFENEGGQLRRRAERVPRAARCSVFRLDHIAFVIFVVYLLIDILYRFDLRGLGFTCASRFITLFWGKNVEFHTLPSLNHTAFFH
jgi:hypothetical protein